jgi:hypothetical protein
MSLKTALLRHLSTAGCVLALAACSHVPAGGSAASVPNFAGVWEMLDINQVVRPELGKPPYTPQAQKVVDEYKTWDPKKDDPSLYCDLKGMPWLMLSRARTYPTEIHQSPDRLNLFFELFDASRTIRLTDQPVPANLTPSINGYSTARWEGQALVVRTQGLAERLYPSPQLRSEKAVITERWELVKDPAHGDLIRIDFTIEDPVVYQTPVKGRQVWKRSAAGTTLASYNCPEKLWLKHVDDKRASAKASR